MTSTTTERKPLTLAHGDDDVLLNILWDSLFDLVKNYKATQHEDQRIATIQRIAEALGEPFVIRRVDGLDVLDPRPTN